MFLLFLKRLQFVSTYEHSKLVIENDSEILIVDDKSPLIKMVFSVYLYIFQKKYKS